MGLLGGKHFAVKRKAGVGPLLPPSRSGANAALFPERRAAPCVARSLRGCAWSRQRRASVLTKTSKAEKRLGAHPAVSVERCCCCMHSHGLRWRLALGFFLVADPEAARTPWACAALAWRGPRRTRSRRLLVQRRLGLTAARLGRSARWRLRRR